MKVNQIAFIIAGLLCFIVPNIITGNPIGIGQPIETYLNPMLVADYVCRTICYLVGIFFIAISFNLNSKVDK